MNESYIQLAYNYSFVNPVEAQFVISGEISSAPKISHQKLSKLLLSIGLALLIFYFTPVAFNKVFSGNEDLSLDIEGSRILQVQQAQAVQNYLPDYDASLPLGSYLKIPSMGVDTQIYEQSLENYEEALKKGAWRVPEYSTPDKQGVPIILAAHRYGYLAWSNLFRRQHSFYNIDKLDSGDTVEITWNQRKYTYAVYAQSEGTEIVDYSADLILYTCEDLSSDVRIFKYAKLLKI